jgi:pimeloyl-ACP methyl ester carboxylesterase
VAQAAKKSPEEIARDAMIATPVRRHAWINIAGPLCAIALGVAAASMYLKPIGTLRWIQLTRLGWSGVTQNAVATDQGLMTYLITGGYSDQAPVVLVHGLGPNAALEWRGVMSPIAEAHFKVVAPNLMGFASSEHKQVQYSIEYQAAALGQMIDRLKLEHINLAGSDIGADVALYYAVDHPEKVERLILVSGGLYGAGGAARLRKGMIPATPDEMRQQIDMSFFGLPPMPDFMYERMMAALADDLPAETGMLDSIPRDEAHIRGKLGQIFNTLTIIINGLKNPFFSGAQAEALHSALPGSGMVTFKTSAAFPMLEYPDDFSESVIFVLKQEEGAQ